MTDVALMVFMKDIFISRILDNIELVNELSFPAFNFFLFIILSGEAFLADIVVRLDLALVVPMASVDVLVARVAVDYILPVNIVLPKLIAERQPSLPEVVVPGEKLNFLSPWDQ